MAKEFSPPTTMRAWRYTSTKGGLDKHLQLHSSLPLPTATTTGHLVQVLAASLNPVDYKPSESFFGKLLTKKPAIPGFDVAGRIITPAIGSTDFQAGDLVFGTSSSNPFQGGALAEYIVLPITNSAKIPTGLDRIKAAGIPIAAVTAHDSLIPYIQPGTRVFINGGSGGVGTFGIQVAKIAGAHVTVSCSTRNIALCRSLGADEVLDYTASPLLSQLQAVAAKDALFDHVVDNVFNDPQLYWQMQSYTTPAAKFAEVASGPSLAFIKFALQASMWPSGLGGGKREFVMVAGDVNPGSLEKMGRWVAEGKVKVVAEKVFGMDEVVEAYGKLKTGRVVGKVLIDVAGEGVK